MTARFQSGTFERNRRPTGQVRTDVSTQTDNKKEDEKEGTEKTDSEGKLQDDFVGLGSTNEPAPEAEKEVVANPNPDQTDTAVKTETEAVDDEPALVSVDLGSANEDARPASKAEVDLMREIESLMTGDPDNEHEESGTTRLGLPRVESADFDPAETDLRPEKLLERATAAEKDADQLRSDLSERDKSLEETEKELSSVKAALRQREESFLLAQEEREVMYARLKEESEAKIAEVSEKAI